MIRPLVKICGIQDPVLAKETASAGANYIGLIFHPHSKRYVNLAQAIEIVNVLQNENTIPVAVFVDQTAEEMLAITKALHVDHVQLHGPVSRKNHPQLPSHYHRIFVKHIPDLLHEEKSIGCDKDRDFILFDSLNYGKGIAFDWATFNNPYADFRWFLAGGLHAGNVKQALQLLHPTGVDVSSGVENHEGVKDIDLIREFIAEI